MSIVPNAGTERPSVMNIWGDSKSSSKVSRIFITITPHISPLRIKILISTQNQDTNMKKLQPSLLKKGRSIITTILIKNISTIMSTLISTTTSIPSTVMKNHTIITKQKLIITMKVIATLNKKSRNRENSRLKNYNFYKKTKNSKVV